MPEKLNWVGDTFIGMGFGFSKGAKKSGYKKDGSPLGAQEIRALKISGKGEGVEKKAGKENAAGNAKKMKGGSYPKVYVWKWWQGGKNTTVRGAKRVEERSVRGGQGAGPWKKQRKN